MCYCVYLGADTDLPLVALDAVNPIFSIKPVGTSEEVVAQHFTKTNIYHVGSWQGCSCGFVNDIDSEDSDLVVKNSSSVEALWKYIDAALLQEDTIEFYTCWAGNQWQNPKERREETVANLRTVGFELEEDVLLTFSQ